MRRPEDLELRFLLTGRKNFGGTRCFHVLRAGVRGAMQALWDVTKKAMTQRLQTDEAQPADAAESQTES